MKRPIPIASAKAIAEAFGYHQVIAIARAVGEGGGEHVTTYGVNAPNCLAAAQIGDFLKFKVMGWPEESAALGEDRRYEALTKGFEDILDVVDELGLADRLKEIERIATATLLEARGGPKRQA